MINKYDENMAMDYENGFMLTSEPYRLGNIMAHYELYKKIINLPGDVVELGVFKGSSLIQFSTFRELLENENSRKIIGFDVFGQFPENCSIKSDKNFAEKWNEKFSSEFISKGDLENSFKSKKINNIELVEGDIEYTLDKYIKDNPHTRIALLHIDTDVYEPAKKALDLLFDKVVKGGVIVFDDYGTVEGETLAIEEFFENKNYLLKKFTFSHSKPSYIIKE